jgi:hypothetical protein
MMMEAASASETSVNFYQTTGRNNPEDSRLHNRRRENLKSHIINNIFTLLTVSQDYYAILSYRTEYI